MRCGVKVVAVEEILPWRDRFRQEMSCQIVHDSLHARSGWTQSYLLTAESAIAGYVAVAVSGPWQETKTVFEFYVAPEHRAHAIDLFAAFVAEAQPTHFEIQTNDVLLTVVFHLWCRDAVSDKIVFQDGQTTALPPNGAVLRRAKPADAAGIFAHHAEPVGDWLLELEGEIVATGGVLYHYNRPYGDLYLEVAAPFRQRGLGSYLIQELKRESYQGGSVPCARCDPANLASRRALQKAGFVPCAHILTGLLAAQPH